MAYHPLQLAEVFIKTGELADALAALDEHLHTEPDDATARRLRAEVRARLPGDESLRAALDDLRAIPEPTAQDFILRSALLERLGQTGDAVTVMAEGCAAFPDNDRLLERYLHLLRATGETAQARGTLAALVAAQPQSWRWLQWAGDLAVDANDDRAAVTHYSAGLVLLETQSGLNMEAEPSLAFNAIYARLLLVRADALRRLGLLDDAETGYNTAAELIPDDPIIPFNLGLLAAQRGDLPAAADQCRKALDTASPTLREHMLGVLISERMYESLLSMLGK